MKLRTLFTLTLAGVSMFVLLASFTAMYMALRQGRIETISANVRERAGTVARLGPEHLRALEPRLLVYYDAQNQPIAFTKGMGPKPPAFSELGVERPTPESAPMMMRVFAIAGRRLHGLVVPTVDGGTLFYAFPRSRLEEQLNALARIFAFAIIGALLLTVVVARFVGGRLARDVDAIAAVARAVSRGDLTARLDERVSGADEIRGLRADLNHMIGELATLLESQRTFIAHAAHEIRSPLTTLHTELDLALRRERSGDGYRDVLRRGLTEVQSLSVLTDDLLLLAQTQRQRAPDVPGRLGEILDLAMQMSKGRFDTRDVQLVTSVHDELRHLRLSGRTRELARALRNLLDNAADHSPPGGTVALVAEADGDKLHISVSDEGPGVPAADAERVFSPFFRGAADQASERVGSGLGLAIAREIARALGGDVTLEATHASGARFVLTAVVDKRNQG